MVADPALGLITNLLEVPGLDAARHGLLVDITAMRPVTVTAAYTAAQEMVILCDATVAAFTVALPPVDGNVGRVYFIKKTDSSANAVTVDPNGSETIDGGATLSLTATFGWVGLVCDGTMWHRISRQAAQTFLALADTPSSFAGAGGKTLKINTGATAVEFVAVAAEPKIVSSLVIDTNQDAEGAASYADCAGTGSITTTVTCTLVITASFRHRSSHVDATSSVKLVNAADATLGTVIRQTAETGWQGNQIIARVTGVAAGTYTCNLMHVTSDAAYYSYVDDKQILIVAYPE